MPQVGDGGFCSKCGSELKPGAKFCGRCGNTTARPGPESSPASGPGEVASPPIPQPDDSSSRPTQATPAAAVTQPVVAPAPPLPPPTVPNVGPTPGPPLPPATYPSPTQTPPQGNRRGGLIIGAVVIGVCVVIAIVALIVFRPSHQKTVVVYLHPTTTTTQPSTTTSSSVAPTGQLQEAQSLNGLLAQSSSDRQAITSATSDIQNCGNLSADVATLQSAAQSRQSLLTQLAQLNTSQLSNGSQLISSLTAAWQASLESDNSYAGWASDLEGGGCSGQASTNYPSWQAAQNFDATATATKSQFVALWNPIASTYGLPQYQQSQI